MEDLDIIRHDIQPGLAGRPRTPVLGRAAEHDHGLQPGREPGSGGPRKSDGRAARPGWISCRMISRSSMSWGLQVKNKIYTNILYYISNIIYTNILYYISNITWLINVFFGSTILCT